MPWFNPALILAAILAFAISGSIGYYSGNANGKKSVQQAWDAERAEMAIAKAEFEKQAREKEAALQAAANRLRKAKDDEIKSINARADAILDSLRDRQARDAANKMPNNSAIGFGGCTGKDLYRQDAEFLVRLAREADEITAAYKQCIEQYENIRKENNEDSSQRNKQK